MQKHLFQVPLSDGRTMFIKELDFTSQVIEYQVFSDKLDKPVEVPKKDKFIISEDHISFGDGLRMQLDYAKHIESILS